EFPFIRRCTEQDRQAIERMVHAQIQEIPTWKDLMYVDVASQSTVDRQFLVERQLMSRELADANGARHAAIDTQEPFSVRINEEDHLRIQVMERGLDLKSAHDKINKSDDLLEEKLNYQFQDRLGYLTACPTNVGTGMRVSVMLHLPALVIARQIEK